MIEKETGYRTNIKTISFSKPSTIELQELSLHSNTGIDVYFSRITFTIALKELVYGKIHAEISTAPEAALRLSGDLHLSLLGDLNGSQFALEVDEIASLKKNGSNFPSNLKGHLIAYCIACGSINAPHIDINAILKTPNYDSTYFQTLEDAYFRAIYSPASKMWTGIADSAFTSLSPLPLPDSDVHVVWNFQDQLAIENIHVKTQAMTTKTLPIQLELSFKPLTNVLEGVLNLEDIPLQKLAPYLPTSLDLSEINGVFSGQATIKGSIENPQAHLEMKVTNLTHSSSSQLQTAVTFFPADGIFSCTLNNNVLACSAQVVFPHTSPIQLEAQLPVVISTTEPFVQISKNGALSAHINTSFDIAPVFQLLAKNSPLMTGKGIANIRLSGSSQHPDISGSIILSDGTFELLEMGTRLQDLNATFSLVNKGLVLQTLTAHDGYGGQLQGTGRMDLDWSSGLPFELNMALTNLWAIQQDNLQVSANGNLSLSGTIDAAALTGDLQSTHALFSIRDKPAALLDYVEVTYINQTDTQSAPQLPQTTQWPLALNIELELSKNITIRGKDLDSMWKGHLSVQGSAKTPLLFGDIHATRGQYLFNGKPFRLNQGSITFAGEPEKKTSLYVIANKDLGKVKVDVIFKGPVKSPSISFRSNPPLPQREILSWILFDRGTSEISPFQGSQLSESITNLDSSYQETDVLSKIRKALGIDRFEISSPNATDDDSIGLQVGKYISDDVFISINKSTVNRLAVEAALTEEFKFQAQIGDDSEGQLFLKWKKDY